MNPYATLPGCNRFTFAFFEKDTGDLEVKI